MLEGHYIQGYGDTQKPEVEIDLFPYSGQKADDFLKHHQEACKNLEKVADLVDGFETPDADSAVSSMAAWSDRKQRLFKPEHIRVAWDRLQGEGWVPASRGTERMVGDRLQQETIE